MKKRTERRQRAPFVSLTKVNPEFPSYQDPSSPLRSAAYEGWGVLHDDSDALHAQWARKGGWPKATRLQYDWCWFTKFVYRNGHGKNVVAVSKRDDAIYYTGTVNGPGTNWTTDKGTRVVNADIRRLAALEPDAIVDLREDEE